MLAHLPSKTGSSLGRECPMILVLIKTNQMYEKIYMQDQTWSL